MKQKYLRIFLFVCTFSVFGFFIFNYFTRANTEDSLADIDSIIGNDESVPPPAIPASSKEIASQPADTSALGGYDVLIADRGNNRLLEITPDKQIVWEYRFQNLPALGFGADDAFFTDGGKTVIVNLENYHVIEQIDYQTKKIIWQYGNPGQHGSGPGFLFSPDDAYKLPNGDVIVADIKNCRVIEITQDKKVIHQYGRVRQCKNKAGFLDAPNGDTPLPNGHILISNILNRSIVELNDQWQQIFSMNLPLKYPSDPQMTHAGNILIADYTNPGKIIEISKQGNLVWEYDGEDHIMLNKPSLAIELPNGNILTNDDFNHRIIVIDKQTKKIIWQYGVTGKPGDTEGQLSIPDGLDIIKRTATTSLNFNQSSTPTVHTVGEITWHVQKFVDQDVFVRGYLLKKEQGYVIFSDEPQGPITSHDLPVSGEGIDLIQPGQKYLIEGRFLDRGLTASNGNGYHLELSTLPKTE